MSKKRSFILLVVFLLSGCSDYMEKRRQIEAQQQATQIQLATIQAETEKAIAAKQAEEQRKASEHRTENFIGLLGFVAFLAAPIIFARIFFAHRARVIHLRLAAAVQIGQGLTDRQREAVVVGLLAQSGVKAKMLLLERQPR